MILLIAPAGRIRGQGSAFSFGDRPEPIASQAAAVPQPPARPNAAAWQPDEGGWLRVAQQPAAPSAAEANPASSEPPREAPSDGAQEKPVDERAEKRAAQLRLIASQLEAAQQRSAELEKERGDWEARLKKVVTEGPAEPRPYSLLLLDKARDELESETRSAEALRESISAAKDAVTEAKKQQESAERKLLRAKEKREQSGDPAAAPALADAVAEAEHALKVAGQDYELRRLELANLQREQKVQSLRLAHTQKRLELYKNDAVFTPAMLDDVLHDLNNRDKTLSRQATALQEDLKSLLQPRWYQARQRLDDAKAAQDESKLAVLEAEVQARDFARRTAELETALIADQQQRLKDLQEAWRQRYSLANTTVSPSDAAKWVSAAEAAVEQMEREAASLSSKAERTRKQRVSIDKKLQNVDPADASLRYWLALSSRSLDEQRKLYDDYLGRIESTGRVWDKLLAELSGGGLGEVAGRWLAEGWQRVERVWDYDLANVDERRITVGTIVKGLFLLVIGVYASRVISRVFGRRLLTRVGVHASAAAALQSIAFYTLVTLFTLFALKLVNVPLTAFTVLGGALALGIGFGSQNIVNNFISGLIMLAERPVKVGDLIQLADIYGNVEHIGARSTRVRTGQNLEIIVPNSTFLETNVVNWTLTDNHMRTHVTFGVAYGSPTGKLTHLALKAAANHDRVFDKPAPLVIFADFGDNALVFELHFWVAVRTLMERRTIESDIRFNIDLLFREAGIVIAFPQRDVRLLTEQPLQVQMAPPPPTAGGDRAA